MPAGAVDEGTLPNRFSFEQPASTRTSGTPRTLDRKELGAAACLDWFQF